MNQSQAPGPQPPASLCRSAAVPCNRSNIFIQLNQNHLLQRSNHHTTLPSTIVDALSKPEDIPLTMPTSIAKQQSSGRAPAHSHYATIAEIKANHIDDYTNGNDGGGGGDGGADTDTNSAAHRHYSSRTAERRSAAVHRNANNNNTIAATNRYRWHGQSDDIPLHCINGTIGATQTSHHRSHTVQQPRAKHHQHHQQNQINNNFIVANKKAAINGGAYDMNNGKHYIDQSNGNHLSAHYYH